jgi:hypothetical protein
MMAAIPDVDSHVTSWLGKDPGRRLDQVHASQMSPC